MSKDNDVIVINEGIKKTGRGGKYNFPNSQPPEDPDVVRNVLSDVMHWYKRGFNKCVSDDDFENRTIEFFDYCLSNGERPTVEKYCLALGYTRQTVNEWEHGNSGASRRKTDIIKKAKDFLSSYDADMVTSGKLNPVPYIFRAKNYYGLSDTQQLVIEPKQSATYDLGEDEIKKFAELPED